MHWSGVGGGLPARVLNVGELGFNLETLEVHRAGKAIQLNPTALKDSAGLDGSLTGGGDPARSGGSRMG